MILTIAKNLSKDISSSDPLSVSASRELLNAFFDSDNLSPADFRHLLKALCGDSALTVLTCLLFHMSATSMSFSPFCNIRKKLSFILRSIFILHSINWNAREQTRETSEFNTHFVLIRSNARQRMHKRAK